MKSVLAVAVLVAWLLLASHGYGWVLVAALAVALVLSRGSARLAGPGSGTGSRHGTARWSTAVHEASHVVAVRRAGGSASATLSADGRTGSYTGSLPDRASRVDEAVIHLAGGVGQRAIVGRDGPSVSDVAQARRALRGTGVSLGQARSQAASVIASNRGAIQREAPRLHG
ncbi:MAG: hypothetical protein ACRDQH_04660 [Pseudonocardiaceae bacterium]